VTTDCPIFDVGIESLARKVAGGLHHFGRREDFNAEVIYRARSLWIFKKHQLERRLSDGKVRVAGSDLSGLGFEELGIESDGLFEVRDIEGELQSGHFGLLYIDVCQCKG